MKLLMRCLMLMLASWFTWSCVQQTFAQQSTLLSRIGFDEYDLPPGASKKKSALLAMQNKINAGCKIVKRGGTSEYREDLARFISWFFAADSARESCERVVHEVEQEYADFLRRQKLDRTKRSTARTQ